MNRERILTSGAMRMLVAAGLLLACMGAHAQNVIESLNVTRKGTVVVVRVNLKADPASAPVGFAVTNSPRVALDFIGTVSALDRNSLTFLQGQLRGIQLVQVGDRARMVLDLTAPVTCDYRIDGKSVIIALTPLIPEAGSPASGASTFAAAGPDSGNSSLREIGFLRGPDGAGRLIVELSSAAQGFDIRHQGQTLVLDLRKAALPNNLLRSVDVAGFGTPVQTIKASMQGDNVRIVIGPKGRWEYQAYQIDTHFVVEVRPVGKDADKLAQGPASAANPPARPKMPAVKLSRQP